MGADQTENLLVEDPNNSGLTTPVSGSQPLPKNVIQGLKYAIADAILHEAKKELLEGKNIEEKEKLLKDINNELWQTVIGEEDLPLRGFQVAEREKSLDLSSKTLLELLHIKYELKREVERKKGKKGISQNEIDQSFSKEFNELTPKESTIDGIIKFKGEELAAEYITDNNREEIIAKHEKEAHQAVVNKINQQLVGNSEEAKNILVSLGYDGNKPKTIPELLRIKHELLFKTALEAKTKEIKSAKAIRKVAEQLREKQEQAYLNELRTIVLTCQDPGVINEKNVKKLRAKLAGHVKNPNVIYDNDEKAIADSIAKAKKDKEALENEQNWIDRAVHQAMFFALSCGTTMAGALLLLISNIVPLWFFAACVFISPVFVLWVTKANWWLTVTPMATVTKELVKLVKMNSDERAKEYKKYHKGWLAAFFISSIAASVVWGVFTYDATIELMFEIGKKFSEIPVFSAAGLAWSLVGIFIFKGLYDVYHGIRLEKRFNSRIIQVFRGIAFLVSAALIITAIITATPSMATVAFAYTFSVLMGVYTAPTIFAVFFYVGKERLGLIKKSEHNSYDAFQDKLKANLKYVDDKTVNHYYRIFVFAGILVVAALCTLFSPFLTQWLIDAELIDVAHTSSLIQTAVSGVMMVVSGLIGWAFLSGKRSNLSKANISLYVLGSLAIWCGLTGLLASIPITIEIYMWMGEWTGMGEKSATIGAYVSILALGGLSAAWFYFSSGVGTILKFFSKKDLFSDAESLKSNPVGIDADPNFDSVIKQVSHEHRNNGDIFVDFVKWVGSWVWPFSNDKDSFFYTVVVLNGGLNATSNAYGAFSAYSVKDSAATVFGAGNCVTGFIAGFAGSTAGNFNNSITPIPSKMEEIKLTRELYDTLVANNIGALAYFFQVYHDDRAKEPSDYSGCCSGCISFMGQFFGYTGDVKKAAALNMKKLLEAIDTNESVNIDDYVDFNDNNSTEKLTVTQWKAAHEGRMNGLLNDAKSNEKVKGVLDTIGQKFARAV